MIIPRNRLLLWFAVVVLPFSLLGAVEPAAAGISLAAIAGLLVLALADAAASRTSLAGISLQLPDVARMSKDREAKLEVRIRNERRRPKNLRLALALPREIESPQEDAWVALPPDCEWSLLTWPCLPRRRGNYQLEGAHLEADSPLGFWAARRHVPAQSEIRVYPDLFTERRNLAALFLHRGSFGLHAQRQVGKGREFEQLRDYIPGDGFDEIHWKATAKRGRPVTKVFQIERTQEVYVVIDASRLSARPVPNSRPRTGDPAACLGHRPSPLGSNLGDRPSAIGSSLGDRPSAVGYSLGDQLSAIGYSTAAGHNNVPRPLTPIHAPSEGDSVAFKAGHGEATRTRTQDSPVASQPTTTLERFVTAALVLGLAAEQQGDLFGLLTFTDQVKTFVRAKNGQAHFNACRDALYTLQPQIVTPDYDEVATFIRLRLRRRALLVYLTSLDDPVLAESFIRNLDLLRHQHLVIVNMLQPPGVAPVFSNPNLASMDELYQHLGGHLLWQNLRELEKVLQRRGVRFSLLQNERLSADLVSQYLGLKQRQAI